MPPRWRYTLCPNAGLTLFGSSDDMIQAKPQEALLNCFLLALPRMFGMASVISQLRKRALHVVPKARWNFLICELSIWNVFDEYLEP
jgi:hypothetical protein